MIHGFVYTRVGVCCGCVGYYLFEFRFVEDAYEVFEEIFNHI